MTTAEQTTETTEQTAVFEINPRDLARALANAAIFTDKYRIYESSIGCIRVTIEDGEEGGRVQLDATDHYRLYTEILSVPVPKGFAATLYVTRDDALNVVKMLKATPKHIQKATVAVVTTNLGRAFRITSGGASMEVGCGEANFPNVDYIKRKMGTEDVGNIGINLETMGMLAKVVAEEHESAKRGDVRPATWTFDGTGKPSVVTIGKRISVLVMPVRIS